MGFHSTALVSNTVCRLQNPDCYSSHDCLAEDVHVAGLLFFMVTSDVTGLRYVLATRTDC